MVNRKSMEGQCPVCTGLLGELRAGEIKHPFCAWARPSDWAALRPYLTGTLEGIQAGAG